MVWNWGGFSLDLVPSSVPGAGSCSLPLPAVSQLNFGPFPDPREFFCVWGQILSDFKLPPFPKSAFLSAWIFWDSPEPRQPRCSCSSPAVLLLLPSLSLPFLGENPGFSSPLWHFTGLGGAASPPQLWSSPSWGYLFFPLFISSQILSHSGAPPAPLPHVSLDFGGFGNFLLALQSSFGIFLAKMRIKWRFSFMKCQ